jgi:DNA (cytosine-5)-methyltransferase 1
MPVPHTSVSESLLLRTPIAGEAAGGAVSPEVAKARNQTLRLSGQMIDMVAPDQLPKLLPTPNTMEHREVKTPEQIAELKAKSPGGYRNLRETVINELPTLPTPITTDYKNGKSSAGYGANLPETARSLFPTPTTRDYKDGSAEHERDGKVQTDTVARAIFSSGEIALMGTPRTSSANGSTPRQVEAGAPKSRIEDQVLTTNWGKFEPAIRRWEAIIGRPAPEPTKPDGKDGNHRLSSKFTEWMMGLPDGWITGHNLKRNDELKLAGNGVVPQQAELALRLLLELPEERER